MMQPMVVAKTRTEFSQRLKSALDAEGRDVKWLAQELGVSYESARKWANGAGLPKMERMVEICKTLGTDMYVLLGMKSPSEQHFEVSSESVAIVKAMDELSRSDRRLVKELVNRLGTV